jgi:hypothetical protein
VHFWRSAGVLLLCLKGMLDADRSMGGLPNARFKNHFS